MSLNIKNKEVERLAEAVAHLAGESKTEAVRRSLEERKVRLSQQRVVIDRAGRLRRFLEHEVWPSVPKDRLGAAITKDQEEQLLGYGEQGA